MQSSLGVRLHTQLIVCTGGNQVCSGTWPTVVGKVQQRTDGKQPLTVTFINLICELTIILWTKLLKKTYKNHMAVLQKRMVNRCIVVIAQNMKLYSKFMWR